MLTAKDTAAGRAAVFGLGAEDYVTKPFSWHEILTRIQGALSREPRLSPRRCVRHHRTRHA
jgi:DNA-binding response OmpR family regulator